VKFSLLHILWFIEAVELQAGSSLWCWQGRWWWDTVWATFIRLWLHLFYFATPRYAISLNCSRRILSHRFLVSFDKSVEIVILFHIISLVNVKWLRPCWCCSHLQFPRSFNKMSPLSYNCTDFTASFLNWQCLKRWVSNFMHILSLRPKILLTCLTWLCPNLLPAFQSSPSTYSKPWL
jgi:hypothetical protein